MRKRCRSPRSSAQSPAAAIRSYPDPMGGRLAYGVLLEPCMKTTIGFIGQGAMGSRMAARLVAAGHDIVVYDRMREATRSLEQRGASVAAGPRQLAAEVDIVFSSVTD